MGNADAVIAALRSGHENLCEQVAGFTDDDLAKPTAASEWDVSQVLSHLGSGAEIFEAVLKAAVDGQPNPGMDLVKSIWARWDSAGRRERADGFVQADAALVELYESLAPRDDLRIDMGFLPEPVDLTTSARARLSEFTLHSWDVRAGSDPAAALAPEATGHLFPVLPQLASMAGKPEAASGAKAVIHVTTTAPESAHTLRLGDPVSIDVGQAPDSADGTLSLPAEALVRLITGRLAPEYTPADVTATGTADLDLLRRVFPGF